jgi:release factor glutamine methyltransferase
MLEINIKISTLRTLFHKKLSHLYEKREIDAIFFIYIEDKYNIKKHHSVLDPTFRIKFQQTDFKLLANGCPIQYITQKVNFYNLKFNVNQSVLIPRPETEELVTMILNRELTVSKILDIGTGSGVIAVALAKHFTRAEVWASDISENALETAQKNALLNNVKVSFLHHDILKDNIMYIPDNIDIIVSNPPYIPYSEKVNLHKNVTDFEPSMALFIPDKKPLLFYDVISDVAQKKLRKGGKLYFETYEKFHLELSVMLTGKGFKEIEFRNDINGKPRFVSCKKL